jgi:methyl-accepting chemotaxis protein
MSETDAKGIITFVNEEFCAISKFSKDELIGNPHSVIRHPDMPKELFQVMWRKIQQGEMFRGVLKNRAKDGSHYWVQTLIKPMSKITSPELKYVSIRHLINNEQMAVEQFQQQLQNYGIVR